MQYGDQPTASARALEINEHGGAILAEFGLDWDAAVDLKFAVSLPDNPS